MEEIQFRSSTLDDDPIVANHLIRIGQEVGISAAEIDLNFVNLTLDWIIRARHHDRYCGFVAEVNHQVVASVGCQLHQKAYPQVTKRALLQYGYIWGLYVEPSYRRQAVASALIQLSIQYLESIGCTQILLHTSDAGRCFYERLNFTPSNEMVLRLV